MISTRKHIILALFASCMLVGCDDPKAATNANFQKALQAYYDAHPVCISLAITFPDEIGSGPFEPMRPQLQALAKAGLVTTTRIQKSEPTLSGPSQLTTYTKYSIVSSAQTSIHDSADKFLGGTDICFAHRKITKVVSFTEPADAMGVNVSQVTYDYTLVGIAPWTKNPAVQSAFPGIAAAIAKPDGEQTEALDLTNNGWRLERDVP